MKTDELTLEWIPAIEACDREGWDRLAAQHGSPLLDWGWLHSLEASGSVAPDYGWIPQHLVVRRDSQMIAAAPLYVKTQSHGEFVFDYAWADVADQLGTQYYPKLVAMSPLSPAVGYRFLVDKSEDESAVVKAMLSVIDQFCSDNDIAGFSVLWPDPAFADMIRREGFVAWEHQHFRWERGELETFDDYLAEFNKNQRRNIRRERASMGAQDLVVSTVRGTDAPERYYARMYEYYTATNDQFGPWAARFLTEDFFHLIRTECPERILFATAENRAAAASGATSLSGDPVGLAMLLHHSDTVIGRYWGARRFVDNLHFNLCYYEPIEWAITNRITAFDPGMGSSHKIRRGIRAVSVSSLHRFSDERMQLVMRMNIDRINRHERLHIEQLNQSLPLVRK